MAEATKPSQSTSACVVTEDDSTHSQQPPVKLKLKKPRSDKGVKWEEGVVDNEFMNKKKSKCCCIYEKPRIFGESSSEEDSDDECNHCRGHGIKDFRQQPPDGGPPGAGPSGQAVAS